MWIPGILQSQIINSESHQLEHHRSFLLCAEYDFADHQIFLTGTLVDANAQEKV